MCLNCFPMSTICLLFVMERVKAQGGGPDSRCCGSACQYPIHSLHLEHLSTMACDWKRQWLPSRKSFCSVFAWSVRFYIQLSLQSNNKLHHLYTCCMQTYLLVSAIEKHIYSRHATTRLRIWMGWQSMFPVSNGYPEEITGEDSLQGFFLECQDCFPQLIFQLLVIYFVI